MTHSSKKDTNIKRYTSEELKKLSSETNYQKIEHLTDEEIDYSDIPQADEAFWTNAQIVDPGPKKTISIRIDTDVLTWFKSQDGRYQRLMNQVLRHYMQSHSEQKNK